MIIEADVADAWRSRHGEARPAPGTLRDRPGSQVDHLFLSPALESLLTEVVIVTGEQAERASDHYPLVATFSLD